ncbi:right-handed parallel beta-helix repeat-containing protein, partial [Klebsiella pneumoniae]
MAFNPELGSTSPAVLLDNAERLDKLVNGPTADVPDRGGDPLYSWRQMMAKNDEIRQNIIPLSKQYATLAAAQADIANIPVNSTTYVRSPDGSALADEYMNVAGTLTATGRRMPSQAAVEAISESLTLQIDDIGDRQIEIQRKIDGFSSSVFDSSANDLLIALTDALGRRTWLEADLRGRP